MDNAPNKVVGFVIQKRSFYLDKASIICIFINKKKCIFKKALFFKSFQIGSFSFQSYPFLFHGFLVSLFSSLIGPFGGFLASGLKRACKQKVSFNRQQSALNSIFFYLERKYSIIHSFIYFYKKIIVSEFW